MPAPDGPLPSQALIVFSGGHPKPVITALRMQRAEAIMVSFEYIRNSPDRFHKAREGLYDWPKRTYLDSGLFTLMRKLEVSRTKDAKAHVGGVADPVQAYEKLASDYMAYLQSDHAAMWDHVVELDCDQIPQLGPAIAREYRYKLREIVGDRLMPVWHDAAKISSWKDLVADFPYVAIGSDGGVAGGGMRGSSNLRLYRTMTDYAHAHGSCVHGLGDTRLETFRQIGWDSADSTTWIASQKFGKFSDTHSTFHYSKTATKSHNPRDTALAKRFEAIAHENGITIEDIQTNVIARLRMAIIMLTLRQARIRTMYASRKSELITV